MPLECDVAVVLVIQVLFFVTSTRAAHHGDKTWCPCTLLQEERAQNCTGIVAILCHSKHHVQAGSTQDNQNFILKFSSKKKKKKKERRKPRKLSNSGA